MQPYVYKVTEVLRVVDGDTVDTEISAGFGIRLTFRFRLAAVDTPEITGARAVQAGRDAKDFTYTWLDVRRAHLWVQTFKGSEATVGIGDGAFGRWLADFYCPTSDEWLTEALLASGHATLSTR